MSGVSQEMVMRHTRHYSRAARRWHIWSVFVGSAGSRGFRTLLSSRYVASPVLACVRPAIAFRPRCRGGSRSCSAICQSLAGCALSHHGLAKSPGVTEPTLALVPRAKYRHASAAPLAGLITFRPLHSISLQFRRLHFRSIRSDGRKLPRPSKTAVRPKIPEAAMLRISAKTGNMAARLRPAKKSALRREAPPVAEVGAISVRSAISAPPPFRKLHCSGQKPPNSLVKPNWSDTTAAGCGQVCRARPCCHRVAAHALRSAVVESDKLAGAGATAPGNATRRKVAGFARRWHEGPADTTLLTSLRGWVSALLSRQPHKRCYL